MTDWSSMTIGEKIKHSRESMGLSQGKLAKISGLAQSSISYIESGNKKPNIETISILAKALDLPVSFLIDNEKVDESLPPRIAELVKVVSLLSDERAEIVLKVAKGLLNSNTPL